MLIRHLLNFPHACNPQYSSLIYTTITVWNSQQKNALKRVISSNIDNFEDDFLKLIEIAKLKEASSEIKDDVLKVVYNDSNKYKYLLSEEITKNIINF